MSDQNTLAKYSFLPWLRRGLANEITANPPPDTQRASLSVAVDISTDSELTATVTNLVQLVGPGDIVGMARDAIVRHEPRHRVTDFEPNYLAHIEFYEDEFLWRYSPMPADTAKHRIVPWITLVVLTEEEFTEEFPGGTLGSGPLPFFETATAATDVFPPTAQLWAWAHVHVNADVQVDADGNPLSTEQSIALLEQLLESNPDLGYARLLCPRKLEPNRAYHAFVIPTFETGRRTGLGEDLDETVGALDFAWGSGQNRFPYYYRWYFRTGARGDFESLVRLLQPRPVDARVGIREMDVSAPGSGIDGIDFGPGQPKVIGMEGALRSPETKSTAWPRPGQYPEPFQQQLAGLINLADGVQPANPEGDPVITPPLYGRWHALRPKLSLDPDVGNAENPYDPQAKWITELNLDPRHRATAGVGTRVVQEHQEQFMHEAWTQIGEVLEANRRLRLAQLAEMASVSLYGKHLQPLHPNLQFAVTAPVQLRVRDGGQTVYRVVQRSKVPSATVSPELRKIVRPRGPIAKRLLPDARRRPQPELLSRINAGTITATPPKLDPAGNFALDRLAEAVGASETLRESRLVPEIVNQLPKSPQFRITEPGNQTPFPPGDADSNEAIRFKVALHDVLTVLTTVPQPPPPKPPLALEDLTGSLMTAIDPRSAILKRVLSALALPPRLRTQIAERIMPVMAYPEFPQPMYEPLRDIFTEFLIPNIHLVPQNTITLLITNQKFIEAYMVGLNHEMGRELLWREYPTDQRPSCFRQFWDVRDFVNPDPAMTAEQLAEKLKDIPAIHTWPNPTALGTHNHREAGGDASQLVLLIRGDVLKRYPNTVIYAHRADWERDPDGNILKDNPRRLAPIGTAAEQSAHEKYPLYSAKVEPDIYFLGFDLTVDEARGLDEDDPGWFFVLKERVGEPRFGLDLDQVPLHDWDDLSWEHIKDDFAPGNHIGLTADRNKVKPTNNPDEVEWHADSNAADLGYILLQDPVFVAVHAQVMLRDVGA